jgi:phosphate acetyltransferase
LIERYRSESRLLQRGLHLIGVVPQNPELTYCRTIDVQRYLNAEILRKGDIEKRRVKSTQLLARTVPNLLQTLVPSAILLTPADRSDVIIAVAMAALSQTPIAGLILVGDTVLDKRIIKFCQAAFETGLPLLRVETNSYDTSTQLHQLSSEVPIDDLERIQGAIDHAAQRMDVEWLISQSRKELEFRLSPAAFLHQLSERARKANKRIVLPEGPHCRSSRQRKTRRRFHPFSSCACRNRCWSMVTAQ